ncbi:Hsp20/alpha crystallin family protein [Epilithonimonas sp.]|uniref:Hsp20/alpha crystallin family protein n=1 Tax=Epilithonimonas sp. TaxID=2894511 RepID=UPI0028A00F98|nr:Hsp20/alpha crystallin family protein [Epilithonimonas sp.]
MALVKTNYPLFGNLFDDFFGTELADWRNQNYSATNTTLPKVNIKEDENGFVVEMAAPGMKKGDFKINVDNSLLTISSQKQEEQKEGDGEKYTRREFAYHAFTRSFTLPNSADADKVSASYNDGILTVTIPKKEEAKPKPPKSIEIS